MIALKPYARADEISYFDDTQLQPGEDWRSALDREIGRANVAVLLVSANFLASSFVTDIELPHVLARAKAGELSVAWLPVAASAYEKTGLNEIQALISPKRPLTAMRKPDADAALVKAAGLIASSSTVTGLGQAMHVVDEVYAELAPEAGLGTGPVRIQLAIPGSPSRSRSGSDRADRDHHRCGPRKPAARGASVDPSPPGQHVQRVRALDGPASAEADAHDNGTPGVRSVWTVKCALS